MYLIAALEKNTRDWAWFILAPLWVELFMQWGALDISWGRQGDVFLGGAMMLAGVGLSLLFMRLLEGWMFEARFRPIANLGLFFVLAGGLILAVVWRPLAGLIWLMFWVGSIAQEVGRERNKLIMQQLELLELQEQGQ